MSFPCRVIVVGAGLAGLTAAIHLAERGLEVLLCDAHPDFLGGRTRAREPYRFHWKGKEHTHSFDHGQHCMWSQYWNMRALLDRLGIFERSVRPCDLTRYLFDDGDAVHRLAPFNVDPANPQPTTLHFLAHMMSAMRGPGWRQADSLRLAVALPRLAATAAFKHGRHYDVWDQLSVQEMFAWIGMPEQLEQVFKSMCKASTFHAHAEISASWGLSMIESTMIGHPDDHKMWRFSGNLGTHLIDPLVEAFRQRGGRILRNASAVGLDRDGDRIVAVQVAPTVARPRASDEELREVTRLGCTSVVSAVDIPGFQRWMLPELADVPEIRRVANLEAIGSVAVRIVAARPVRAEDPPMGIFSGAFAVIDTYFRLSSYQDEFAEFQRWTGGEVLELHAYLASRELAASPPSVVRALVEAEALRAWPELRGQIIHLEIGANERTFDKQGVGHARFQPRMRTAVPNLLLCGSWIKTEDAVHDMEKAVVTGLRAANALLEEQGLEPFIVHALRASSPLQRIAGLLSPALPKPPVVRAARAQAATVRGEPSPHLRAPPERSKGNKPSELVAELMTMDAVRTPQHGRAAAARLSR